MAFFLVEAHPHTSTRQRSFDTAGFNDGFHSYHFDLTQKGIFFLSFFPSCTLSKSRCDNVGFCFFLPPKFIFMIHRSQFSIASRQALNFFCVS
jgi:hypothetical protein